MTQTDELLECIAALNPGAMQRAKRLVMAITMLRTGHTPKEARALLQRRSGCQKVEAWRLVEMALDMAGPVAKPAPPAKTAAEREGVCA
jgi:hypothetical protein